LRSNLVTQQFETEYLSKILEGAQIMKREPIKDAAGKTTGERIVASRFVPRNPAPNQQDSAVIWTEGTRFYQVTSSSLKDALAFEQQWKGSRAPTR
jgi:hypothetical protein